MGGILWAGFYHPPRKFADKESPAPLVMELLPLDQGRGVRDDPVKAARPLPALRVARGVGTRPTILEAAALPTQASSAVQPISEPMAQVAGGGLEGAASRAELSEYQRTLYELVARNSRYPADARRLHLAGITQLAFRVDRAGTVLESWVQESSGSEMLDDAALAGLAHAEPLPRIPASLPARLDFVIEIDSSVIQQMSGGLGG